MKASSEAVVIRDAEESDIGGIQKIFTACYADHYVYPQYYDAERLKRLIFDRDVVFLVVAEKESGRILGTGSVIVDIGASGDLMGEFGRLAVHPDGRGRGIASLLMDGRIDRVKDRLHVGIVENRAVHPYSQRISDHHGFVAAGFLPLKNLFAQREHVSLYVRHFGDCLKLRRNDPRIVPEAWPLADEVLRNCGIGNDAIVDDETLAYALGGAIEIEEMTSEGYTSLLHFERGRVRHREILGPVKLHVGLFQLRVSHYHYLLAKKNGHLIGGVGYFVDDKERAARILELVSANSEPVRFLLEEVVRRFLVDELVEYIEVDVNAHSTAMQRTFLELGFLPAAYIPAMSFHRVERLDGIRMVRILQPLDSGEIHLHEASRPVANLVIPMFKEKGVAPELLVAMREARLFQGLNEDQLGKVAVCATVETFGKGAVLVEAGGDDGRVLLLLSGAVEVGKGLVSGTGEAIGLSGLLEDTPHHSSALALEEVEALALEREALAKLIRRRPDIGVAIFRNLALELRARL